jgi:hypothetical protein
VIAVAEAVGSQRGASRATGVVAVEGEATTNPVVTCPLCGHEWIAEGTQFLFAVDPDMTDEEVDELAVKVVTRLEQAGINAATRTPESLTSRGHVPTALTAEGRTPHDDSGYTTRLTTMAEVKTGLEGVPARLAADRRKWVLVIDIPMQGMPGVRG